jgi:hypothetical protein
MKKKIKNLTFILLGIIILHYNSLIPLKLNWHSRTQIHYSSFCEIQDGALAGTEEIKYRFFLSNGDSVIFGNGTRNIDLIEKKELSLGFGGHFPLYKSCTPAVQFECYETKNNKSLGIVDVRHKFEVFGLLSRTDFRKIIHDHYIRQIHSKLKDKEKYIDELAYVKATVSTDAWDAHQTFLIDLSSTGENIAPIRKLNLKYGLDQSKDSLLFSSHSETPKQYHHEIITFNRNKGEMVLKRFSNSGKLIFEAIFEEDQQMENDLFKEVEYNKRRCSSLILSKFNRYGTDEYADNI